jgi:myosin heavy subunit
MRIMPYLMVAGLSGCGIMALKSENKRLGEENDDLRQQQQEESKKREEAETAKGEAQRQNEELKNSENTAKADSEKAKADALAAQSAADKALADQTKAAAERDEAVRKADESKRMADDAIAKSEAEKRELEKRLAATPSSDGLPLKPFNCIWIAEKELTTLPQGCSALIQVGGTTITNAVICDDGSLQSSKYKVSGYTVRGNIFPGSLGQSAKLTVEKSTCAADQVSVISTLTESVFEYASSSGASVVNYMFALADNNKKTIYQATATRSEFGRASSCEELKALAATDTAPATVKRAATLCQDVVLKQGCFTASGFVAQ